MSIDVQKFLTDLASPAPAESKGERLELVKAATIVAHSYEQTDPNNQLILLSLLKKMTGHRDSFKGALVESLLYHTTHKTQHLKKLASHLLLRQGDFTESNGSFYSLSGLSFNASGNKSKQLETHIGRRLFMKLLKDCKAHVQELYDQHTEPDETPWPANNQVVILTRQILMPPHAPTVDTLQFASRLIKEYGKQVVIISTSEASAAPDGAVAPATFANLDQRFAGNNKIDYDGVSIPFLLAGNGIASEESVVQILQVIDKVKPEMILSIGSPSLMGEAFAHRCFSFMYPTSKGIPLVEDISFHTWDQTDADMENLLRKEKLADKHLFAQHPGFDVKPPSSSLTREQFNIPADAFVFVVVGIRLDTDVSPDFIDVLNRIVQHPKAFVAFAGNFETYEDMVKDHETLANQSCWLGFQTDIMAVYNISDVFINPDRKGGGSGIVYALQAGLPVLSLPNGDAGLAAAGFPAIATYDEMVDVATSLLEDPVILKQYQDTATVEAPKFSGRAALLQRIMEEFNKYQATRTNSKT